MITKVDGITHYYKLMNASFNKNEFVIVTKKEFEKCLSKINYKRDWWANIVFYIEKHTNIKMGVVTKNVLTTKLDYFVLKNPEGRLKS